MVRNAIFFGLHALFAMSASGTDIVLRNDRWQASIDPSTLALTAMVDGKTRMTVSTGGSAHAAAATTMATRAEWTWDEGAYEFSANIDGDDLILTIRATSEGELMIVRQPAEAMGQGLILPFAEGHYVPRGQATWQRFLTNHQPTMDTVEELSLPLWGNIHGSHSLTWILPDSFDNRLDFAANGDAVTVALSHRFTPLTVHDPVTLILHLDRDESDLLAGARRYRRWLVDNGRFEPMADKLERVPDMQGLHGATHIYLWGGLLSTADVTNWQAFSRALQGDSALASMLRKGMGEEALSRLPLSDDSPAHAKRFLLDALNEALASHARRRWMGDMPDMERLSSTYATIRQHVAELFTGAVHLDAARWGGWAGMIDRLRDAGLRRLWLGHGQGWEPGLWHPEAVSAAVAAGYLIAPYDSYETALTPDVDPSWSTAHLGRRAFDRCGILGRGGKPQTGFLGKGRYTDPRCMNPTMRSRVEAIRARVPYNSWFLDAYATGMSFESYREGATMTRRENVAGAVANMRWMQDAQRLPTGSEGGNAFAAGGLAFAHGMLTPVIGWSDPDMGQSKNKNPHSRYFVGAWYPANEAAIFFKAVPLKEIYRTVHVDPRYRLPLYQAVFHDSVIATHHWLYDNLKFTDVRIERELTQLLYNVPGLYHLSEGTLTDRLPAILRQDAFFAPLHRRLATQALTRFEWLSADRQVQRTTFADGTRLVANFSGEARTVGETTFPPRSVTAIGADGTTSRFSSR
ncbi:glycoside hydrolase [Luteibacter sp.]|jgi:hypothetical protein|uniref:glycoside hydrolase n=1 Tax=Luteibacter sp. TaxID=1886636 RepID=UPI002F3EFF6B